MLSLTRMVQGGRVQLEFEFMVEHLAAMMACVRAVTIAVVCIAARLTHHGHDQ